MTTTKNPYAAPQAPLEKAGDDATGEQVLAGRGRRLGGALIDGLVISLVTMPVFYFTGVFEIFAKQQETLALNIGILVFSVLIWLLLNGYLIYHHAQTIGKRLVGTRIVRLDGRQAEMSRIVFYRMLAMQLLTSIPIAGGLIGLVNVLFIFGADRRCLHDYIAGTRVVMA